MMRSDNSFAEACWVLSWGKLLLMIHPICSELSSRDYGDLAYSLSGILEILLMNWRSHSLHGLERIVRRRERTEKNVIDLIDEELESCISASDLLAISVISSLIMMTLTMTDIHDKHLTPE